MHALAACTRTRAPGSPRAPQGQRFIAATSWNRAGNDARPSTRETDHDAVLERLAQRLEHRPCELRELVEEEHAVVREARLARPRRGAPPPTMAAAEAEWCGARNGGTRISPAPGASTPATEWIRVTSSAASSSSGGRIPGQPAREHRLAGAGRAGEEHVVRAGGGDLERAPGALLAAHVAEVGHAARRTSSRQRQRLGRLARRRAGTRPRRRGGAPGSARFPRARPPAPDSAAQTSRARPRAARALGGDQRARGRAGHGRRAPARRRRRCRRAHPAAADARPRAPRARSAGRSPSPPCAGRPARG